MLKRSNSPPGPSMACRGPMNPFSANNAADMPAIAARPFPKARLGEAKPAWIPPAPSQANPKALSIRSWSSPNNRPAAAAAPTAPAIPSTVAIRPRGSGGPNILLSLPVISHPTAKAFSTSRPVSPFISARAITTGKITLLGWIPRPGISSSKSSRWIIAPLARAAFTGEVRNPMPITVHLPLPPIS